METIEKQKETQIEDIKSRGYERYPVQKKEFPDESGTMICLFQASSESKWVQIKIQKKDWNCYKKTTDIKNREFYWKPS